ncbi:hypothetical protein DUI87_05444 [Hirundo rustica rustica]|uniref:Uncharacterized protein n=1 Tax=Hirundo rustica rustica TaxID=333673 RepID=A0A3M0KWU8_HIRRU|nr:hypothetical protein DUI87_05444 [Hirundo rustica rustica]
MEKKDPLEHQQRDWQLSEEEGIPIKTFDILDIGNPDDQTHINPNAADSSVEEIFREDVENKTQKEQKPSRGSDSR